MENGYEEDLSIDRIDVDGDYCPDNCRWVTQHEQTLNTRRTRYLTYRGETHNMREWSEITGIPYSNIRDRISGSHWDVEDALTIPVKETNHYLTYRGETRTMREWADEMDISYSALSTRINDLGWDIETALTTPVQTKHSITYKGETHSLVEWAEILDMTYSTLKDRLFVRGWSVEKAFSTPIMRTNPHRFKPTKK